MQLRDETTIDVGIAALLTAAVLTEVLTSRSLRGPIALNVVGVIAFAGAAGVSRRRPVIALAILASAAVVQAWLLTPLGDLVTPFAVIFLTAYRLGMRATAAGLVLGCVITAGGVIGTVELSPASARSDGSVLAVAVLLAGALGAGRLSRRRLQHALVIDATARGLEERLEMAERLVIAREQARISRELHDELAHTMTVIVLQAGAAQRVWQEDPDAAASAVSAMAEVSRAALTHLRSTLAVLTPPPASTSGFDELGALIDRAAHAGLDVTAELALPAGARPDIEHVIFHIVQESLTNVTRYAAPSRVELVVRAEDHEVLVRVRNGRRILAPGPSIPAGAGTGLRGLRHRIEALGGRLRAGPCDDGGYLVEALLPIEART